MTTRARRFRCASARAFVGRIGVPGRVGLYGLAQSLEGYRRPVGESCVTDHGCVEPGRGALQLLLRGVLAGERLEERQGGAGVALFDRAFE
jgi:hypothetical protein